MTQPDWPLSPGDSAALFHHIDASLFASKQGRCDHSHRLAREWCEAQPLAWPPVRAWLHSIGAYCDCDILLNAAAQAEREDAR